MFSVKCKISRHIPEIDEIVETFIVEVDADVNTEEGQNLIKAEVQAQVKMFNQSQTSNNPNYMPAEFISIEEILVIPENDEEDEFEDEDGEWEDEEEDE